MVNYCCVNGCGRNSKKNTHLYYYSIPKERNRQIQWLKAAGREDLLDKSQDKLKYRFCSRHFSPSSIKNKHLCADAVPSLYLPGSWSEDDLNNDRETHQDIVCDSCKNPIMGFRYKCVTCQDFDLCPKCEMLETHAEHYMLRIPKPLKFKLVDDLIKKWRMYFKANHVTPKPHQLETIEVERDANDSASSDDEPITKYAKHHDNCIDLADDVKTRIRNEVIRVLNMKNSDSDKKVKRKTVKRNEKTVKKRVGNEMERPSKKQRVEMKDELTEIDVVEHKLPEVAFADVEVFNNPVLDVKLEDPGAVAPSTEETVQPLMHVKISDDLSELMIEVTKDSQKTVYKYST